MKKHLCASALLLLVIGMIPASPARAGWDGGLSGPDSSSLVDLAKTQKDFVTAQATAFSNSGAIGNYVQAGITLSDTACNAWLSSLDRTDREVSLFKDMFNIVGNLILGVSGINGASSEALARGALFLGAGNAAISAYRNEILLGTISSIKSKVNEGREVSAKYFVEHVPGNYYEAQRLLLQYHDTCSPSAVKELVNTSLTAVRYEAPDTTLSDSTSKAQADILASTLYSTMYKPGDPGAIGSLSDDTLYRMYVTLLAMPADTNSELVKSMKADANVAAVSAVFNAKNDKGQLAPMLQRIAELRGYPQRLAQDIAKEKAAKTDQAAAQAANNVQSANDNVTKAADEVAKQAAQTQNEATTPQAKSSADRLTKSITDQLSSIRAAPQLSTDIATAIQKSQAHSSLFSSQAATDLTSKMRTLEAAQRQLQTALERQQAIQAERDRAQAALGVLGTPKTVRPVLVPVAK